MTTISTMIRNDVNDDLIIQKIEEVPFLLNEECIECDFDYQTSFMTAVLSKRVKLIKYMIRKGADFEKTISKLEEHSYLQEFSDFLKKIVDEIK